MDLNVDDTRQMRNLLLLRMILKMNEDLAHKINNPLQVMMAELALMQSITEDLEPVVRADDAPKITMLKESVEVIGSQIKRCSKIAKGLLNFSRKAEDALQ
jgi:two-component system, NtrC family, sensor kinase